MSAEPLVSVVIPTLNAAPWIGETIASCLNQTWRHLEIIVVDNGSTDGTLGVVRSMQSQAVRIYESGIQNAAAARNVGMARSNGDYIQYLDADDVLSPSKIADQFSRLQSGGPGCIASGPWARFEKLPLNEIAVAEPVWRDLDPLEFLLLSWGGGGMMPNFGWLTPRHIIEKAGPWDESLTLDDDGEFFTRVVLESSRILFCPSAMGYYRTTRLPSLSKTRSREAFLSGFSSVEQSVDRLLHVRDDADARRACAFRYQRFAYDAYPEHRDLAEKAERRAKDLGGCDLAPSGGKLFQLLSLMMGWKKAKRLRAALPV
jgi:glycosyltransferase involved in cell wall biosynthesis